MTAETPASDTLSRHSIDSALRRGAVMLTPHPRLARTEGATFDAARHAGGERLWQPATILPWRAWTGSLWRDALVAGIESRILLNDLQERVLWEQVVAAGATGTLRSMASLARLCSSATKLLGAYDLRGDFGRGIFHGANDTPDANAFARWWLHFETHCSDNGFLPASHAEAALAEHMRHGRITPAKEYLLHGFDAMTPAQQHLIAALETVGAKVLRTSSAIEALSPPTVAACASPDEEFAHCAAWARRALEQPCQRVAIVVPDLDACRPVLERALRAAVAPELTDVTNTTVDAPYEFSTGRALAALPMIDAALQLLQWCAGDVSVDSAGAILRSGSFTFAATPERGAELDAFVLRDKPALRGVVSMSRVAGWLEKTDPAAATLLRTVFAAARNVDQRSTNHAFFADAVRSLLRSAGWPGDAVSSEEHQAQDRWDETLDRVTSLDALGLRVTFAEFLERISQAAHDTTFAPENTDAPLQVTTVAEAIGRDVDALWFMHADERTWPPRQRPHALLPIALQRASKMPGANPREDEAAAQAQLDHLLHNASSAAFSYACMTGETAHRPSPLVLALDGLTMEIATDVVLQSNDEPQLESLEDVAPLPALPGGIVPGGVGVLSAQALCGFRAFAEKRLFSREMETNAAGLSAGDRGEQVHSVLEAFWKETKDQQQLKAMSADRDSDGVSKRDHLLRQCIDEVIKSTSSDGWETSYMAVQRERLFLLLTAWLDFEATRPPFRVAELEMKIPDAAVGPLRLELRVDRIDRVVTNGEEAALLIDYKTGSAIHRKTEWMGERPSEPQLPVYAVAGGIENVQAVAFGTVKVGKLGNRFETMAAEPKMLSSKAAAVDIESQLGTWQNDLTQLATDFAEGRADVAPKDYPKTCDRCGQRMLCRLDASALLDLEDMDDEDDEEGLPW